MMTEKSSSITDSKAQTGSLAIPRLIQGMTDELSEENGIARRQFHPDVHIVQPLFFRSNLVLVGIPNEKAFLRWITVSISTLYFEGVTLHGFIQVTAKAHFSAKNCVFYPADENCECSVNVFAKSTSRFENCVFEGASQTALLIQDSAAVEVINCKFENNKCASITVLDDSTVDVRNSTFSSEQRYAVYIYRHSKGKFSGCKFQNQTGLGILCLLNGEVNTSDCQFSGCKEGAISVAKSSKADIEGCSFSNVGNSSVHVMLSSTFSLHLSSFTGCNGNCVNIESSKGSVSKSSFVGCIYPAFSIFGAQSVPTISQCMIQMNQNSSIVIRDCASPHFSKVYIEANGIDANGITASDFSCPVIDGCYIVGFLRNAFSIYNGAKPHIIGNCIVSCGYPYDIFTAARPTISNNIFCSLLNVPSSKRLVHHDGILEGEGNEFSEGLQVPERFLSSDMATATIEECKEFQLDTIFSEFASQATAKPGLCYICKKKEASVFCSPCGHRVYCDECAAKMENQKPPKCPLCQNNVGKLVTPFDLNIQECIICRDRAPNVVVLPCGHGGICYNCANEVWQGGRVCPACRVRMAAIRHIFASGYREEEDSKPTEK